MKFFQSLTALMGAAMICSTALAQEGDDKPDKIGSVNMQRLVNGYYKTSDTRGAFKQYEDRLREADKIRLEEIKLLEEEAKSLQASAEENSSDAEKRSMIFKEATLKRQRVDLMQKGRVAWARQKQAAFNDKINMELGKHRKEIIAIIKEFGNNEGYDYIFDRSGTSGAGVPILSYAKDATDLTGLMLERINKDGPEKEDDK